MIEQQDFFQTLLQDIQTASQAQAVALFLVNGPGEAAELALGLPNEAAIAIDLFYPPPMEWQIRPYTDYLQVEVPLVVYQQLCLGVIYLEIQREHYSPAVENLLQEAARTAVIYSAERMLADYYQHLPNYRHKLLRIYEAIPRLEISEVENLPSYLKQIAQIYQVLEWEAVRITVSEFEGQDKKQSYATGKAADDLPPIPADYWLWVTDSDEDYAIHKSGVYVSIIFPIRTADHVVSGLIELYQTQHHPLPDDNQLHPLMLLAEQFSNALDRYILVKSLRHAADKLVEQVDELEFIRQTDREISSRLDPDRIVQFTLDAAMRRTAADAGAVVVVGSRNEIAIQEWLGYPTEIMLKNVLAERRGIVGRCISEARTQVVEDVSQDPDYVCILKSTVTQVALPLLSYRKVIGALTLESRKAGRFDSDAVLFLERIVSMAAIALDNAQLLRQAEQLADDMSLIYNASRTISSSLEWESAIQSVAQGMALAVRGSVALVYSHEARDNTLKLLSVYTAALPDQSKRDLIPPIGTIIDLKRQNAMQQAITSRKLHSVKVGDLPGFDWLEALDITTVGVTPMTAQGKVMGLALLLRTQEASDFADSEIFVAESLATQAAAVMRQAALYAEVLELETLKSEVIRMTSHDIRSPISNALGYLDLLSMDLDGLKTPDMELFLDSIRRSIDGIDQLVEDLLTLEKIESQRQEGLQPLEFQTLVEDVFGEQHRSAQLKKQALTLEVEGAPFGVRGHEIQLRQSMSNLIGNSIKYTPDGGWIKILVYRDGDKGRVYFAVQDNGFGIPKERQTRIFQRFYRAKQAGTEEIPGTGLGLSLVKTIVERHHGDIYFESAPEVGSTFTFWLPLAED